MAQLVAVADPTTGTVQVTLDWDPAPAGTSINVYRVYPDGTEAELIGSPTFLSSGRAIFYDNAAPFDVAFHYRAVLAADFGAYDLFSRVTVAGWGSAPSGQAWTTTGGAAGNFSTDGTAGNQQIDTINVFRHSTINIGQPDMVMQDTVRLSTGSITGAAVTQWFTVRRTDDNNYYAAHLEFNTTDVVTLRLLKRVGGTLTFLDGSIDVATSFVGAEEFTVKVSIEGLDLKAKAWRPALGGEPADWMLEASDSSLLTGNLAGLSARLETGNTNPIVTFAHDNFFVFRPGVEGQLVSNTITLTASPDGWLKNPILPTVDIRIDNCEVHTPDCLNSNQLVFFQALDTEEYESATGVFPIVGSARPIIVAETRKDLTTTLMIVSRRLEDITAIRTLLSSGEVLTLSLPAIYGWGIETFGTDWVSVGTVTSARIATRDMRKPYRMWALPLVVVRPEVAYPSGQTGGNGIGVAGTTWGDLAAAGLTWAALAATGNTWLDTAQGDNY